jgi:hypothetical protein
MNSSFDLVEILWVDFVNYYIHKAIDLKIPSLEARCRRLCLQITVAAK